MTSRFATPPEEIPLENDSYGYHLPGGVAKSWKTLEQSCRQIATVLRALFERNNPKIFLVCPVPDKPSQFGYFTAHSTKKKARAALSESLDSFVLLFAYVSFCIAINRLTNDPTSISLSPLTPPGWFRELSAQRHGIHPEWLQLLADSPISNFSTAPRRRGSIINVSRCSWIHLVPYMLDANVPIWFYWGVPPVFVQPLVRGALDFAPRSHPQCRAPPLSVDNPSQSGLPTPSQSIRLPVPSGLGGPGQLPGETWKDFMTRQNRRRKKILSKESAVARQAREGRENTATKRSCPGKKGPTVYIWEDENGVWTRTLLNRGEVEGYWGNYKSSQKNYNSIDNCWDLCYEFDVGVLGEINEYDSNDSDNDSYRPPAKQSGRSPSPKNGRSGDSSPCPPIVVDSESTPQSVLPAPVSSDYRPPAKQSRRSPTPKNGRSGDGSPCPPIVVDSESTPQSVPPAPVSSESDYTPMVVDPTSSQVCSRGAASVPVIVHLTPLPSPGQVVSDPLPMVVDSTPLPVLTTAQVTSNSLSTVVDTTPLVVSSPAEVASDLLTTVVEPTSLSISLPGSDPLTMVVDSAPLPVTSPAQVATRDPNTQSEGDFLGADEDDEDPYDASRQDVLNAYSFAPLDPELMPVTTLDDLLYYRYGFSLNYKPYTGIPSSYKDEKFSFRSWTEVCRAVGGQDLESSALNRGAIQDFLSILAVCRNPLKDVPGKYWDLSPLGRLPIVDLSKVYISIDVMDFADSTMQYLISPLPRFLHNLKERDASWSLCVDSMTALECIRRGVGPHTIDIANFFIAHGVRFRTYQRIENSPSSEKPPVRPQCRYLGYRSLNYTFDLADFARYEVLRDSFLRSQPHGPLALREGGINARLAREVLLNSNALSGLSSEALGGHCARLVCDDKIYVEDEFSDAELRLICGTYTLADKCDTGLSLFLNY